MSEFRDTLKHHLAQTRAGLYGQFENSFNFEQGFDQDSKFKIGPGESITFSGKRVGGEPLSLVATNNLTGPAGTGFIAQTTDPDSSTVVIGDPTDRGQVSLGFSAPSGGTGGLTVSMTVTPPILPALTRWEAYDVDDTLLLVKGSGVALFTAADIVRAPSGKWYTLSKKIFGIRGTIVGQCNTGGTFDWTVLLDRGDEFPVIAWDETAQRVVVGSEDFRNATKVRGYDPLTAGGAGSETFVTTVPGGSNRYEDMKAGRAAGAGFVYFVVSVGIGSDNVYKIDSLSGSIVATYDLGDSRGRSQMTVNSVGQVIVTQPRATVPEDGGAAANTFLLDENLVLLNRQDVDWSELLTGHRFGPGGVAVTTDGADNIYLIEHAGIGYKYDASLTTVASGWPKRVLARGAGSRPPSVMRDMGHDQASLLYIGAFGAEFGFDATIARFDNDGVFVSSKKATSPSTAIIQMHLLIEAGGGPGPDLGACYTSETSQNPPGRIQAVAAVKYQAQNVTAIFFNSCAAPELAIDPDSWTAVHSVGGAIPFGPNGQWDYHSPLF